MCLGGFGPQMPPIPPNERARKLGDYLKVVVGLNFILAILFFIVVSWITGIFDIIGALIGYMGIRDPNGYNFQSILCYTMFCGMEFIWAIVRMIMYFASAYESVPTTTWQLYMFVGAVIAGPIIYCLGCVLGYHLYKELRLMMMDPNQGAGDAYDGAGGPAPQYSYGQQGYSQQPAGAPAQNLWRHEAAHPAPAEPAGGFRAFTGQGHKLGA